MDVVKSGKVEGKEYDNKKGGRGRRGEIGGTNETTRYSRKMT